jgi:hypothetical protein
MIVWGMNPRLLEGTEIIDQAGRIPDTLRHSLARKQRISACLKR